MRVRLWGWWLLALPLLPVLLPMALYTRRTALRLPEAEGPQHGLSGAVLAGTPLRLLLLGESTVAGVGVDSQAQALAGQLALALVEQQQCAVAWQACGENGITVAQAQQRLLPQGLAAPVDLVVLVFGVNDTTHLSSLRAMGLQCPGHLHQRLAPGAQVAFTSVPPLQHFAALPWLLRQVLGLRGALLDRHLRRLAEQLGAQHCAVELEFAHEYLAIDGYHPSALGYQVWAKGLAAQLKPLLRPEA